MAQITNQQLLRGLRDDARIQNVEAIPTQLAEKIVPVLNVQARKQIVLASANKTNTGSSTLLTTSSIKRTFITNLRVSNNSDATADNVSAYVTFTPRGQAQTGVYINKLSLTAINQSIIFNFQDIPIELEKGTTIAYGSSFTVGASSTRVDIFYYEED